MIGLTQSAIACSGFELFFGPAPRCRVLDSNSGASLGLGLGLLRVPQQIKNKPFPKSLLKQKFHLSRIGLFNSMD
jgi:hypothetical protein